MSQTITKSELLFEKFCKSSGIKYERIPEASAKTPDYYIYLDGTRVAVEVKEMVPNPEEERNIQKFEREGRIGIRSQLGKRAREKIRDTAGKFKEVYESGAPSILVLYNKVALYKHTEPYDILAGMYGQLEFPVFGNVGQPLKIGEMQSGPRKKMTADTNTSISAVAVLKVSGNSDLNLSVYHNHHARVPLAASLLSGLSFEQHKVNDPNNPTE